MRLHPFAGRVEEEGQAVGRVPQVVEWKIEQHVIVRRAALQDGLAAGDVGVELGQIMPEAALRAEIDRGVDTRMLIELISDPARFFLDRGAERVIFIGGEGSEDDLIEVLSPIDPGRDGGWKVKIPACWPVKNNDKADPNHTDRTELKMKNGEIIIGNRSGVGLILSPYRAPVDYPIHKLLIQKLRDLVGCPSRVRYRVGLGQLAYAIANHARTKSGRLDLSHAFSEFVGSSNRSSLSLISAPFFSADNYPKWNFTRCPINYSGVGAAAWLSTGDAELLASTDLIDWKNNYVTHLADVKVLTLPHHGSSRNSGADFQAACPHAILTAHVKANAKKHPSPNIAYLAAERLVNVTSEPHTLVSLRFQL